ncbi:ABC transporter permease [Arthrobacter sp. I2-34]|uniref:ABC transporter permease n=1 Tax=Arthrobacter hankyongi TaxID=2904801 RepID=A0ABS9L7C0_9MICC|nr:ABC transporter permease [Arthrobacter hankyongi]
MNPAARFLRSRSLVVTVVVLIASMVLSVFIQERAQVAINDVVDKNARGIYDILVLPKDTEDAGGTLRQPDVLTGTGGITAAELNKVRGVSGVAVAAPISLVSKVIQDAQVPQLKATDYVGYNPNTEAFISQQGISDAAPKAQWPAPDSVLSAEPKRYRITAKAESSDGKNNTVLFENSAQGTLGQAKVVTEKVAGGTSVRTVAPEGETGIKFPDPAGGTFHGNFDATIALPVLPQISETVVAVDPIAEQALLGDAGSFLAPLAKAPDASGRNAEEVGGRFMNRMSQGFSAEDVKSGIEYEGLPFKYWSPFLFQYQSAKEAGSLTKDSQVIPMVVRAGTEVNLKYTVTIEEIDDAGNTIAKVGSVSKNLGDEYLPFASSKPFELRWPGGKDYNYLLGSGGIQVASGLYQPAKWSTNFVSSPEYTAGKAEANGATDQTVIPQGWVQVNQLPEKTLSWQTEADKTQREPVEEQSYRQSLKAGTDASTPLPFVFGTFDADSVRAAAGDINYLPLGGYDPTPLTLTKDAQGKDVDPTTLSPGLSGAGLATQSAGAITDYTGLAAVRGTSTDDAVIDAVRVRVNAAGSWQSTREEIAAVAADIAALGLHTEIVAGSAREDVTINVPEYRKDNLGTVSDLGTVAQSWVRQGSATGVQNALSSSSVALLALTVGGAALVTAASTITFTRNRRTEAVTLRAMGWTRRKIRSWFLNELLVGGAAILAVAAVVVALSRSWVTAVVAAAALVIYLAASFTSAALLKPHPRQEPAPVAGDKSPMVDNAKQYAARQLLTNRFNAAAVAVSVGVLGAAAGALVAVLVDLPRAVGSSALSVLAVNQLSGLNLALALLGVLASLMLTLITGRFDLPRKRAQWATLSAMGWGPALLLQLRRWEAGILAVLALPLAILGSVAITLVIAPHAVLRAALAAILALLIWFIVTTRTRK